MTDLQLKFQKALSSGEPTAKLAALLKEAKEIYKTSEEESTEKGVAANTALGESAIVAVAPPQPPSRANMPPSAAER